MELDGTSADEDHGAGAAEAVECPEKSVSIRWLIRADTAAVADIDGLSFEVSIDAEEFCSRLQNRAMIGLSVEAEGRVVGFVLYELQKDRLRIDRMAIHPDFRRSGYGTAIIDRLKGKLSQQRRQVLFADVSDRDLTAHLFLKSCGLRAVVRGECYRFTYRLESQGCHAERG